MKTILQALKDEVHYKLSSGFFENRLLERKLNGNDDCTAEILTSKPFKGLWQIALSVLFKLRTFQKVTFLSASLKKIKSSLWQIAFTMPLVKARG